jgi:predicted membrane-bound dolichyl-phosphate-mannose-protein mannosyltransferase
MAAMRARRILIGALLSLSLSTSLAPATFAANERVPRLADIMGAIQTRHVKAWYAGKASNWELADFEVRQLEADLVDAAMLYAGIPVSNLTTMSVPLKSLGDAIAAKDSKRFSKTFAEFTAGCNGCHASMGRSFIAIRVPAEQQPFGDQVFSPQGKP